MNARKKLFALQWSQLKHDEAYHKDIVILPVGQRVTHMALHVAKYVSYFFDAIDNGDNARIEFVLTDTFIIALATANTLNQDLGAEIGEAAEVADSLTALGADLARILRRSDNDPHWFARELARYGGTLAKACESLDHMENVPFREMIQRSNASIVKVVLAESTARQVDIADRYNTRIRQVESRSIFDRIYREGAGVEA